MAASVRAGKFEEADTFITLRPTQPPTLSKMETL